MNEWLAAFSGALCAFSAMLPITIIALRIFRMGEHTKPPPRLPKVVFYDENGIPRLIKD